MKYYSWRQSESPKRGPLEVELKSNELIPSDPILNLITLCVGAAKVRTVSNLGHWESKSDNSSTLGDIGRVQLTTVLHLETLEE